MPAKAIAPVAIAPSTVNARATSRDGTQQYRYGFVAILPKRDSGYEREKGTSLCGTAPLNPQR